MTSSLAKTLTISRAGTSMINGLYTLDTSNKSIRYIRKTQHPTSNKPLLIEIIKAPIPQLDAKQTFFIIQAQNVHYYASKSPFSSSSQEWQSIAGIAPLPNISISHSEYNKMKASVSTNISKAESGTDDLSHIAATKRTFLSDTYLFNNDGIVVYQGRDSKHGDFLILNDTIFHPQGGGQAADKGSVCSMDGTIEFKVHFVANHPIYHDLVCHFGAYSNSNDCFFKNGDSIKQSINQSEREGNARLHSGGHLIDIGMHEIGNRLGIHFEPIKGYHFAKGPYVEYEGDIPLEQRSAMKEWLQSEMDSIIGDNQSLEIEIKMMKCDKFLDEVAKIGNDAKEREEYMKKMRISKESMVRVMSVPGFANGECMCGGTHIDRIGRIKKLTVTKFKKKNKNFRVSYKVE